jgi:ubiquinone/menaquinone biosynthesis C-methylase UbiE
MIRAMNGQHQQDPSPTVEALFDPATRGVLHFDGSLWGTESGKAGTTPAFEGLYGRIYNRVIQSSSLRRALFSLWGSTDPLHQLDVFVADAVRHVAAVEAPLIVDLPSGGGTLLPLIARSRRRLRVVEIDLAEAMLRRAVIVNERHSSLLDVSFVRANALALPLREGVADVVVSVNGLHVMPDPGEFLAEIARVLKPDGALWLITPVDGEGVRSRLILRAAHRLGVISRNPPTLIELEALVVSHGFQRLRSYGGASITGAAFLRV